MKRLICVLVFVTRAVLSACGTEGNSVTLPTAENTPPAENEIAEPQSMVISQMTALESDFSSASFSGDDGFEEFLSQGGASSDAEVTQFLTSKLLADVAVNGTSFGCSTLSVSSPDGHRLFGRNFDWQACNVLVVTSKPTNGYASISTVNLGFISQNSGALGNALDQNDVRVLAALYAPLDGMNEKGLAVSVNMIQDSASISQSTDKPDLTTTTAVRLMLNKAANVDEALALLQEYDLHASMDMMVHFALADTTGRAVVVEYVDNQMVVTETLVAVICVLFYLLWDKGDGKRWAQMYYGAGAVLLLSSFSEYHLEIILGQLAVLLAVKLVNRKKEMAVLEGIVVAWVGFTGLWLSDYWYCWILAGALAAGALRITYFRTYQQIVTTISVLLVWWSQCRFYLEDHGLEFKWFYPVGAGILLLFFLLFNHRPRAKHGTVSGPDTGLKNTDQTSYNVITATGMGIFYLVALFMQDLTVGLVMMALGGASIMIMFGKRYRMYIPRRYLLLAGFWSVYALISCVDSPVLASILLMVSALGCVGIGFRQLDKAARVSGLVMAIFVCIKLVFFDFARVQTIYKMIVFLVVGILALVISFLYILLEKNTEKKKMLQTEREPEE